MTDEIQNSVWPLPKFEFCVIIDGNALPFQEISGLEAETPIVEYRHSDSPNAPNIKMPNIAKYGNVTAKKGVCARGEYLDEMLNAMRNGTFTPRSVTISLNDKKGIATITWTLNNAFIAKMDCVDLRSDSNEVVVDALEIVHEGMTAEYPDQR